MQDAPVTAQKLDGTATAAAIKAELTERVRAARPGHRARTGHGAGRRRPGLAWYVSGKHKDCAEVGIESLRDDLPATATQDEVEAAVRRLNANPACTGYIVQLPLPKGIDENAVLGVIDPAKDADGLHPANLGWLVLGEEAPLPCTPLGIVELLRRHDVPIAGAEVGGRPRRHRRPPAGAAAHPSLRERDRDAVPHRHPGPGRARPQRRHRGRRGRRARHHHRRHGQARCGGARRRRLPRRRQDGRRRGCGVRTWPGGVARTPAGSAR